MIGVPRIMAFEGPQDILRQIAEGGLVGDDDVAVDVGLRPAGKGENAFAGRYMQFDGHLQGVVPDVVRDVRRHGIQAEGDPCGKAGDAPVPRTAKCALPISTGWRRPARGSSTTTPERPWPIRRAPRCSPGAPPCNSRTRATSRWKSCWAGSGTLAARVRMEIGRAHV